MAAFVWWAWGRDGVEQVPWSPSEAERRRLLLRARYVMEGLPGEEFDRVWADLDAIGEPEGWTPAMATAAWWIAEADRLVGPDEVVSPFDRVRERLLGAEGPAGDMFRRLDAERGPLPVPGPAERPRFFVGADYGRDDAGLVMVTADGRVAGFFPKTGKPGAAMPVSSATVEALYDTVPVAFRGDTTLAEFAVMVAEAGPVRPDQAISVKHRAEEGIIGVSVVDAARLNSPKVARWRRISDLGVCVEPIGDYVLRSPGAIQPEQSALYDPPRSPDSDAARDMARDMARKVLGDDQAEALWDEPTLDAARVVIDDGDPVPNPQSGPGRWQCGHYEDGERCLWVNPASATMCRRCGWPSARLAEMLGLTLDDSHLPVSELQARARALGIALRIEIDGDSTVSPDRLQPDESIDQYRDRLPTVGRLPIVYYPDSEWPDFERLAEEFKALNDEARRRQAAASWTCLNHKPGVVFRCEHVNRPSALECEFCGAPRPTTPLLGVNHDEYQAGRHDRGWPKGHHPVGPITPGTVLPWTGIGAIDAALSQVDVPAGARWAPMGTNGFELVDADGHPLDVGVGLPGARMTRVDGGMVTDPGACRHGFIGACPKCVKAGLRDNPSGAMFD